MKNQIKLSLAVLLVAVSSHCFAMHKEVKNHLDPNPPGIELNWSVVARIRRERPEAQIRQDVRSAFSPDEIVAIWPDEPKEQWLDIVLSRNLSRDTIIERLEDKDWFHKSKIGVREEIVSIASPINPATNRPY